MIIKLNSYKIQGILTQKIEAFNKKNSQCNFFLPNFRNFNINLSNMLGDVLREDILSIKNSLSTHQIKHNNEQIDAFLLTSGSFCYVSDGATWVQAIMLKKKFILREDQPKPFNTEMNIYYHFDPAIQDVFHFPQGTNTDLVKYPHPYQPQFHFKAKLEEYATQVHEKTYQKKKYQRLLIKRWGFRLVNISGSGYYGPVLELYDYEQKESISFPHSKSSYSILYNRETRVKLEELRTADMRNFINKKFNGDIQEKQNGKIVSMCYYKKNSKGSTSKNKLQPLFMVVDKEGKYIAHKQEAKAYIVLGNAKGICKFIKPLSNILKSLKPKINFSLISSLIENKMSSRNEEESEQESESPEDESQDQFSRPSDQSFSSQNSSEQESILQRIYTKQIKKHHIV